jgi:glycine/D-amino acid oxidase-like deaminating enzyme
MTPITGQRVKPTWRGDVLIPFARERYRELEPALVHDVRMLRVFETAQAAAFFHDRWSKGEITAAQVTPVAPGDELGLPMPHGGCFIHGASFVNIVRFLDVMQAHLLERGVVFQTSSTVHRPPSTDLTVACTGLNTLTSPLWKHLPLLPNKGEVIDVRIEGWESDMIVNAGTWIAPIGDGLYRVGATHDWDDHTTTPSDEARAYLRQRAERILQRTVHVVAQRASVRPSTQTRRPFAGRHPEFPDQAVLTGLGTKGTMLAPYVARDLVRHLVSNEPLDQAYDITTYPLEP